MQGWAIIGLLKSLLAQQASLMCGEQLSLLFFISHVFTNFQLAVRAEKNNMAFSGS